MKAPNDSIAYGIHRSPFGWCVLGLRGSIVCHLSFLDTKSIAEAKANVAESSPGAGFTRNDAATAPVVERIFSGRRLPKILLDGTPFQVKVWEALLAIPKGKTVTYGELAVAAGVPKAVRAVGSACGKNNIAYLIPCHRVLAADGKIGAYRWNSKRKATMLAWEASA